MEAADDPLAAHLRVVLVHDWLTGMRGGEKCLDALCRRLPRARLFNLLHRRGSVSPAIERLRPRSSFLQHLPGIENYYRYLLPLMPLAARWRVPPCDVVLSLSHCVAKAACPPPGVPHVCYCLTPMRYAWHLRSSYLDNESRSFRILAGLRGWAEHRMLDMLRDWDRRTAERVTHFIAVSETVQQRIADCYGRHSQVIYPPVDTDFYCPAPVPREDFYLVVSALVPYKRIDLAVSACTRLGRRLHIIGTGPESGRLRVLAGDNVQFLDWQSDSAVRDQMRRCKALLFPGEEDFGIVPVEAQACGAPVIAFGRGGATESVIPSTGLWFAEQSVDSLATAIEQFEKLTFDPHTARSNALRFHADRFTSAMLKFLVHVSRSRTQSSTVTYERETQARPARNCSMPLSSTSPPAAKDTRSKPSPA
ncbi:MAG: glycosyltransferase family 4 protein [Planctomycetes bacterium]|nr:glycosyltransferase family 4 protein [Planctomycetota bacterium]